MMARSLLLAVVGTATALDNRAMTPPRGWRSWNLMLLDISQERILAQAAALAHSYADLGPSLLDVGYDRIGIDDGWQDCGAGVNGSFHDSSGFPIWNKTRFPDPREMVQHARKHGVGLGWYSNNCWCKEEQFEMTGGHPLQDAVMAAELGFSGIKVDGCGPQTNMSLWSALIKQEAAKRKVGTMLIEDCLDKSFWWRGEKPTVPTVKLLRECPGHFYRVSRDIAPNFLSAMFNINFMTNFLMPYLDDASLAPRPGCWSYPDMLELGVDVGPSPMSFIEGRTHFAAWCILSSPLVLGFDLTNETLYRQLYPIIANRGALSVSEAWAGNSGRLVANSSATFVAATPGGAHATIPHADPNQTFAVWQVWAKPMERSAGRVVRWAVLLINLSPEPLDIPLVYKDVGGAALGDRVDATDVWSNSPVHTGAVQTVFKGVAPHDSVFLFLSGTQQDQEGRPR